VTGRSATTYTLTDDRRRKGSPAHRMPESVQRGFEGCYDMLMTAVDALGRVTSHGARPRNPARSIASGCEPDEDEDQVQKWLTPPLTRSPKRPQSPGM